MRTMTDQSTWRHQTRFPTSTEEAKRILDGLLAQMSDRGWDEQDVFGVHLAVEEAMMNAIKHGNQLDPSKQVFVDLQLLQDQLTITIADEGDGFDPDKVPDPTDDENLELPSGRGLMLMRSFMNTIDFNERGNQVVMQKRRTQ